MAASELLAPGLVLAAFAGGAVGASIGALPSFSLAGLVVVLGELYELSVEAAGAGPPPVDVTGSIGFGVVLGPHVAFGGGAAALAYAARRGYPEADPDGAGHHPAKAVTRGLGNRPDVLAVGGAFGVLGYWIATASAALSLPVDPVALGVVGSALAHRLAFGYSLVGAGPRRWLAVSTRDRVRADGSPGTGGASGGGTPPGDRTRDGDPDAGNGARPPARPWLAYQYRPGEVLALGLVTGVLGAYVAYLTASPFLAFGISVVALAFLNAGVERVPVTHHATLPASTAALALVDAPAGALTPALVAGSVGLGTALAVGAAFGAAGALAGELLARVLYAHAETHLDPPAASIVVTSALIAALAAAGVFASPVWIPLP